MENFNNDGGEGKESKDKKKQAQVYPSEVIHRMEWIPSVIPGQGY